MNDISVQNIVKAFEEDKNILDGLSFDITAGEKVGLLGRNGAGKTTLFRIISGEIESDEGDVVIPAGKRIGIVAQIPRYPQHFTAEDVLKTAHERIYRLGEEMDLLASKMQTDNSKSLIEEYGRVSLEFERLGGYELDRFRNTVANGLQIPKSQREQLFESLSGGEKTRINLARLILEETDILLLDEPTNHLDMKATEWLEEYLLKFKGTVLVISHDRYFLDRIVTRTVEIVNGKAELYNGNYSFYLKEKQRRYEEQLIRYEREQAEIKRLSESADRLYQWGTGNSALMKKSFAIRSRIEHMTKTEKPQTEKKIYATFSSKDFRGDEVLSIKGLSKSYGEKKLFSDVEVLMEGQERIALLGDNGTGKSTLLKIIMNEEKADTGLVRIGPSVKIAYLPQIIKFNNPHLSVLDTLIYEENYSAQSARNRLGAFKFSGEDVYIPVSQLSGGEQSRLRLCILMKDDINLLILDEPTNHLDIHSREWVEEAVEGYNEALLFVSHDRYFINRFATRIWELEDGKLRDFRCGYEEYRAIKAAEFAAASQPEKKAKKEKKGKNNDPKKTSPKNIDRILKKTEDDILKIEEKLAEIDSLYEEYATDYLKLIELDREKEELSKLLEEKYESWENYSEQEKS